MPQPTPTDEPHLLDSPAFHRHPHQITEEEEPGMRRPPDLRFLASTNFSQELLLDQPHASPLPSISPTPAWTNSPTQTTPTLGRRYLNLGLPSPAGPAPRAKPRPKSAIFVDSSISEHGTPVASPVAAHTPRLRNLFHFGRPQSAYGPSVYTNAPPMGPPSATLSRNASPTRSLSPSRVARSYRAKLPVRRAVSPSKNPFNFKQEEVSTLSVKTAHRKGHKYKHSSVSMNLFQEPPPPEIVSQQLAIPDRFPIPNLSETLSAITPHQKAKLAWSWLHFSLLVAVFLIGFRGHFPALSTLAHLIFYDSLGSFVIVFVDLMSNFEVWNSPSIAYPFGLGRLEVLVGFALSASLIMVGCDLVSHFFEELVMLLAVDLDPVPLPHHHVHGTEGPRNWVLYELALLAVLGVSVVTSRYILADHRINDMISPSEDAQVLGNATLISGNAKKGSGPTFVELARSILRNPTRGLTLIYALYLMVVPIVPELVKAGIGFDLDDATSLAVAALLCFTGWRLVKSLGGILLLSYPRSDYDYRLLRAALLDQTLALECFKSLYSIDKLFVTKFNYQLYVVGVKITMKGGSVDDELRIRFEIARLVTAAISRVETQLRPNIETTIDIDRV